MMHAL